MSTVVSDDDNEGSDDLGGECQGSAIILKGSEDAECREIVKFVTRIDYKVKLSATTFLFAIEVAPQ